MASGGTARGLRKLAAAAGLVGARLAHAAAPVPPPADAPRFLKTGDRIVFLGDSITEQRQYTNYVETYLVLRYPTMNLSFVNAGWGGDTSKGGLARLERDVLGAHPTVVTICFGMNDGGYGWTEPKDAAAAYGKNVREIIARLAAKGVRVVLMSPGVVDDAVPALAWLRKQTDYNAKALRAVADEALAIGRELNVPTVDLHALMSRTLAAARRRGVDMGTDGIHPDAGGSLIMAHALLTALGVPPRHDTLDPDVSVTGTRFSLTVDPAPYAVEEPCRKMLPFLPFNESFNRIWLTVRGVTAPAAVLVFDGRMTPVLDRSALEAGLALEETWGSAALAEAGRAAVITREKANMYRQFWRALALPDNWWIEAPYDPEPHRIALETVAQLEAWRRTTLKPPAMSVEIRAVDDAPVTLAAGDPVLRWRAADGFAPEPTRPLTGAALARLTRPGAPLPDWPRVALDASEGGRLDSVYASEVPLTVRLLAILESDRPQAAVLSLETKAPLTAVLNGRAVKVSAAGETTRTVPLALKAGANRLLLDLHPEKERVRGVLARLTRLPAGARNRW